MNDVAATDETLARNPPALPTLGKETLSRIARLAYCIANEANRQAGMPTQPPWEQLNESTRAASARGVHRTVQAMVLLGLCEQP